MVCVRYIHLASIHVWNVEVFLKLLSAIINIRDLEMFFEVKKMSFMLRFVKCNIQNNCNSACLLLYVDALDILSPSSTVKYPLTLDLAHLFSAKIYLLSFKGASGKCYPSQCPLVSILDFRIWNVGSPGSHLLHAFSLFFHKWYNISHIFSSLCMAHI